MKSGNPIPGTPGPRQESAGAIQPDEAPPNWFNRAVLVVICLAPLCAVGFVAIWLWPRAAPPQPVAAPSQPARVHLERLGGIATPFDESFTNLVVREKYAYLIHGTPVVSSRLQVVDVSDPTSPEIIGSCPVTDDTRALEVSDNLVCVLDKRYLRVFDIANPMEPHEVGYCELGMGLFDVEIQGRLAYVTDGSSVRIVDLTEPSAPKELGHCEVKGAQGISVAGDFAYVASNLEGMLVVDVSVPALPKKIGAFPEPRSAMDVDTLGDYAYVAGGENSEALWIADISDPKNPRAVGRYGHWVANSIAVDGDYAFVGGDIVDISRPAAPVRRGTYPGSLAVIVGDCLYTINSNGFSILRVPTTSRPGEPRNMN